MAYADFLIRTRELHENLQNPEWCVVDCRFELSQPEKGLSEYLAGHIPGAVYAHLDRDLAAPVSAATGRHPLPQPARFEGTLGRLGISRDSRVVVYDQGGGAIAARLWWMLRWMGHPWVRLLDGGFAAWLREGLPLEAGMPVVEPAVYSGVPDGRMIVTTAQVAAALVEGARLPLVDARDPLRFEGTSEPIDPVAGHLPGARNFPFSRSLTPEGAWRPPAELRETWSQFVIESAKDAALAVTEGDGGRLTAMCGSGVTACHLVLSAGLAGLPLPRLYVGSWSEWIRDPARPVAIGPADPPAGGR
jgi:thiosulfate/3-mercaptopyruvate sulfurtransferase